MADKKEIEVTTLEQHSFEISEPNVTPGIINFPEYPELLEQAKNLAEYVKAVDVTPENVSTSKKLVAQLNKKVTALNGYKVSVKRQLLEPFVPFESQIKEVISEITHADTTVRSQVRELEEKARAEKEATIKSRFDRRKAMYDGFMFNFEDFLRPQMLNKTASIEKTETEMAAWFEQRTNDVEVIKGMDNAAAILQEYRDTFDLGRSITTVNQRLQAQKEIRKQMADAVAETTVGFFVYSDGDAKAIESFLMQNHIKFTKEG